MWGAIAGIGAHLIVSGLVLTVLFVTKSFMYLENSAIFFTAFGLAAAVGMVLARCFGGRRGAALFAVYCLAGTVADTAQAWIREEQARGAGCCIVIAPTIEVALWQVPALAGLILGLRLRPPLFATNRAAQVTLEAAGVYALASLPVVFQIPLYDPRVLPFEITHLEWHVPVVLIASACAALVMALRRPPGLGPLRAASLMATIGLLTVAFDDLSTWLHVPLHGWTYSPQSLVLVPLASAGIALMFLAASRAVGVLR